MKKMMYVGVVIALLSGGDAHARLFNRVTVSNTLPEPIMVFTQLPGTKGVITINTPGCVQIGNVCWNKHIVNKGKMIFSLLAQERMVARLANDKSSDQVFLMNKKIEDGIHISFPHDFVKARVNERGSIVVQ